MQIGGHDVPNELILQYCKVIVKIEKEYSISLDCMREEIHNKIFDYVNINRAGISRTDRAFIIALNNTVCDLTTE